MFDWDIDVELELRDVLPDAVYRRYNDYMHELIEVILKAHWNDQTVAELVYGNRPTFCRSCLQLGRFPNSNDVVLAPREV